MENVILAAAAYSAADISQIVSRLWARHTKQGAIPTRTGTPKRRRNSCLIVQSAFNSLKFRMHSSMNVDFNIRCEIFIYFNNAAADVAIKRVVGAKHSYAMKLDFHPVSGAALAVPSW